MRVIDLLGKTPWKKEKSFKFGFKSSVSHQSWVLTCKKYDSFQFRLSCSSSDILLYVHSSFTDSVFITDSLMYKNWKNRFNFTVFMFLFILSLLKSRTCVSKVDWPLHCRKKSNSKQLHFVNDGCDELFFNKTFK